MGTVSTVPGRLFIVHKHAARRLHFDLRLEMDGVLRSWAVPKGPSYDPNDKRLAVKVEDHPLEYGDFEGIIPEGNYGAGGVIVWDRGEWIPLEDWREGLSKGKLLFEFRGYKLQGKWTLVKMKKTEKDWLLIKERDGFVRVPGDQFVETSVLSGLTVEEVKLGKSPVADPRRVDGARLHARRLDFRAQARRLSLDRQQDARRGDADDSQREQLHRGVSRGHEGARGLAVRRPDHRRRSRRARRAGQAELRP